MVAERSASGVSGEVWSVDHNALARLDELEGLDEGLYRREPLPLPPPFAGHNVQTYVYARDVSDLPRIENGNWPI
jgi:gamma-glutamylcyclotransferase (GGCT)/AIG2-like uncharacterized protein YtfP